MSTTFPGSIPKSHNDDHTAIKIVKIIECCGQDRREEERRGCQQTNQSASEVFFRCCAADA